MAFGTHLPFEFRLWPGLHWHFLVGVHTSIVASFFFVQSSSRRRHCGTCSFGGHFGGLVFSHMALGTHLPFKLRL